MKLVSRLWLPLACGLMLGTSLTLLKSQSAAPPPAASAAAPASKQSDEEWIRGGEDEKFRLVSKHLRGLDVAMIETGYRYTELYWAGQDRNWEFAAYQLDKIRHTIELGLERRPKRAASARLFLTNAVPLMKQALDAKSPKGFDTQFKLLTVACNTCHAMEKMPFVQVQPPEHRHSSIRLGPQ